MNMQFPLSLAAIFFSSFALAFPGALMPGPVFMAVIGERGRSGAKAGPLYMTDRGRPHGGLIVSGIALSLSNPYWTIGLGWLQKSLAIGAAGRSAQPCSSGW